MTRMLTPIALITTATLAACAGMPASTPMASAPSTPFSQDGLPDAVKVPAGHQVAWETVGVGEITYECRPKAGTPGAFEWFFVGPKADLKSRTGQVIGSYFGPPATWAALDGSRFTGKQLAVAPAAPGNIPLQLVQANPVMGSGALTGESTAQPTALCSS